MNKGKVIIDVATIYPGKGGAGGGIWSYAANLLQELDQQVARGEKADVEIECMVNEEFPLSLQYLKINKVGLDLTRFVNRFYYVHAYLPFYAKRQRAVLHKLYFEVPFFSPVPVLVTIHDCMGVFYKERGYRKPSIGERVKGVYFGLLNRIAVRNGKLIFTPSAFVKQEICRLYGIDPGKILVTPLATAFQPDNVLQDRKASGESVKLFCVAAFHRHKGHLRLVEIFEKMMVSHQADADLYLRGHINDQEYYQELRERVDLSPVKDRIHFVPYNKETGLKQIYETADWLVLLSEYEGFGLPVIEAQAAGVPVICSDLPVFKEVAGDAALFISRQESIAAAAEKVYSAISDDQVAKSLVASGLTNVGRFSWDRFGAQMVGAYTAVINVPFKLT